MEPWANTVFGTNSEWKDAKMVMTGVEIEQKLDVFWEQASQKMRKYYRLNF